MIKIRKKTKTTQGFSLVEMLVSIGLFAVVSTMSIGTLLTLIAVNGRTQAMHLVMTNLSFSIDSMTREIRTGYDWYCDDFTTTPGIPDPPKINSGLTSDCLNGSGNTIHIVETGNNTSGGSLSDPDQRRIIYWFDPNRYGPGHGAIMRSLNGVASLPVTGEDVMIDQFELTVFGTSPLSSGDDVQPTASIYIKGRSGDIVDGATDNTEEFELQTTIVQRLLDV